MPSVYDCDWQGWESMAKIAAIFVQYSTHFLLWHQSGAGHSQWFHLYPWNMIGDENKNPQHNSLNYLKHQKAVVGRRFYIITRNAWPTPFPWWAPRFLGTTSRIYSINQLVNTQLKRQVLLSSLNTWEAWHVFEWTCSMPRLRFRAAGRMSALPRVPSHLDISPDALGYSVWDWLTGVVPGTAHRWSSRRTPQNLPDTAAGS